jgi:hypothetical protein
MTAARLSNRLINHSISSNIVLWGLNERPRVLPDRNIFRVTGDWSLELKRAVLILLDANSVVKLVLKVF